MALLSQAFQHAGVKRGPRQNLIVAHLPRPPPQRLPAPITARLRAGALGGRGERHVIPLCGSIRRRCRTTCDDSNGYLRGERGPPPPALSDKAERRPSGRTLSRASPSPPTPTAHSSGYFRGTGGGGCTNARSDLIQRDRLQRPAEDVSFYAPAFVLLPDPPTTTPPTGKDMADRAAR